MGSQGAKSAGMNDPLHDKIDHLIRTCTPREPYVSNLIERLYWLTKNNPWLRNSEAYDQGYEAGYVEAIKEKIV